MFTDVFVDVRKGKSGFCKSGFETCSLITESGIKAGESVDAWLVNG